MGDFETIISGFMRIIQVGLYISLIVAGIALVIVSGYSVVRGHGARWNEMLFAAATLVLVAWGIGQYPAILMRSVNVAIEQSQPEMVRLTGNIDQLLQYGQTGIGPVITPTVTVYVAPPTPMPQPTAIVVEPVTPTPTTPNIALPAVTATPSPVPTLDPANWNPQTPPPTRSR